jgi:hypothetical protein
MSLLADADADANRDLSSHLDHEEASQAGRLSAAVCRGSGPGANPGLA